MKNKFFKSVTLILVFAALLALLASCESLPLKSSKKALTVVGTVDEFEVTYEELYFLVHSYSSQLDKKYGENASSSEEYLTELKELIRDNIVSNYAVLKLAKENGLSLDSETVKEEVQNQIDAYIESDFGGKRSNYKKSLKEMGTTDNYVRFSIGTDVLYSQLISEYLKNGVINDNEAIIRETINEEFIRTKHIMILNGDGSAENYERAEEALEKLNSGTSMYKMIGSAYNDDLMLTTDDGYYFARGTMDEAYEEAAYALEINEISGIVASVGENPYTGEQENCYYIIQRLDLEDEYIDKNFETLKDSYFSSVVYDMVSELQTTMSFSFNEYGASLNLSELEAPSQTDPVVLIIIFSVVFGVLAVASIIIIVIFKKKRKNQSSVIKRK